MIDHNKALEEVRHKQRIFVLEKGFESSVFNLLIAYYKERVK
jgi:hypothetical protein